MRRAPQMPIAAGRPAPASAGWSHRSRDRGLWQRGERQRGLSLGGAAVHRPAGRAVRGTGRIAPAGRSARHASARRDRAKDARGGVAVCRGHVHHADGRRRRRRRRGDAGRDDRFRRARSRLCQQRRRYRPASAARPALRRRPGRSPGARRRRSASCRDRARSWPGRASVASRPAAVTAAASRSGSPTR